MYANRNTAVAPRRVTSPDSALASDVFDKFCNAVTFKSILSLHRQLCDLLRLKPTYFPHFYPKLKVYYCTLLSIIIVDLSIRQKEVLPNNEFT